jgi:hypothetical protein
MNTNNMQNTELYYMQSKNFLKNFTAVLDTLKLDSERQRKLAYVALLKFYGELRSAYLYANSNNINIGHLHINAQAVGTNEIQIIIKPTENSVYCIDISMICDFSQPVNLYYSVKHKNQFMRGSNSLLLFGDVITLVVRIKEIEKLDKECT